MALLTADTTGNLSGSIWLRHIGTTTISNVTVATITNAGIFTNTFTAPNLVDACNGVWICISTLPTNGGNIVVTLQDNSVDTTATTYATASTLKLGWNYFRFGTPYTFASLAAGRYRFKVTNSVGSSGQGQVRVSAGTAPGYTATYGSTTTAGTTDDLWIGGKMTDDVLTAVTVTVTGTSNTFGSGSDTNIAATSNVSISLGLALTVGNGGTFTRDKTSNTSFQMRGTGMPYLGGTIDLGSSTTDRTITATTVIDNNTSAGQFGFSMPAGAQAGDILSDGYEYDVYAKVVSGTGTAADPLILDRSVNWDTDCEIVFGTKNGYTQQEKRFIKTRNSGTSFVLSNTVGGAEAALTFDHAGAHCNNLTKNAIVTAQTSTRGYFFIFQGTTTASAMPNTRFDNVSNSSSKGIATTTPSIPNFDRCVATGAGGNTRGVFNFSIPISGEVTSTVTGIVTYGTTCTNQANAAIQFQGNSNARMVDCFGHGDGTTAGGCHFAYIANATNIQAENCWSYGANGANVATSGAWYVSSAYINGGDSCGIQGSRLYGLVLNNAPGTKFTNSDFGNVSANGTSDIFVVNSTYNSGCVFSNCNFSATPISNYLNTLDGTDIAFQDYAENTSSHRWYTNRGSFWSSGTGLTDTTTRTAGSLSLAIKPENSTTGAEVFFKVPANPTSNVQIYGYIYRNATFSSGDITCELFLPGTLLTDTPDDTVTLSTTTGAWELWTLNAYYSGSVARYATVRITGKTATAGAYMFLDDIYDAQTNNKVAGMDLWDIGHISPIMLALDLSALPEQTRVAVWSDNNTYGAGEKGKVLADTEANTDVTQAKVDTL